MGRRQLYLPGCGPPAPTLDDRARGRQKNDEVRKRTRRENKRIAYYSCHTCGAENVVEAS